MSKEQRRDLARYAILSGAYLALASIAGLYLLEAALSPAVTVDVIAHGIMFLILLGGLWWAVGELLESARPTRPDVAGKAPEPPGA